MIPQRNISLLSNRLARGGGRRIPEAVLERDYCLAWFLVGLSRSGLRGRLAFKGGTAIKRCYFGDYRFSEDLDFRLVGELPLDSILAGLQDVYADVRDESGVIFRFSREDRKQHLNSHTFYLAYEGPLPSASPKEVKVDITISERFVCPLEQRQIVRGYDEYADMPEDRSVQVYSLRRDRRGEGCSPHGPGPQRAAGPLRHLVPDVRGPRRSRDAHAGAREQARVPWPHAGRTRPGVGAQGEEVQQAVERTARSPDGRVASLRRCVSCSVPVNARCRLDGPVSVTGRLCQAQ